MKPNLRHRNIVINSYFGMLAVTVVGALATFFILHVAYEVPLSTFASPATYEIGVTR